MLAGRHGDERLDAQAWVRLEQLALGEPQVIVLALADLLGREIGELAAVEAQPSCASKTTVVMWCSRIKKSAERENVSQSV
ncbi:MAG: hypothetical protein M4D80_13015 [Myxococcota bacterium]|nr:hypothetical protein [Myxococcota bacterium]